MIQRIHNEIADNWTSYLQKSLLLLALLLTVVISPKLMWPKAGWMLLAILITLNVDFGIYASYFMSTFFIGAGYFPNLEFTIKHFHIAFFLTIFILLLRGELIESLKTKAKFISVYWLWIFIVLISSLAGFINEHGFDQILKTNANLLSVILSAIFLTVIIYNKETFVNAIYFYALGTCARILIAFLGILPARPYYMQIPEVLLFNNHIGFLASSSLFLMISLMIHDQKPLKQIMISIMILITLFGTLVSCSRTGWLSIIITSVIFAVLNRPFLHDPKMRPFLSRAKKILAFTIISFVVVFIIGIISEPFVFDRIVALGRLMKAEYWSLTFNDRQNFGFLGIYRLNQFAEVKNMLQTNWFIGTGLDRAATNLHSLFLTILGGVGIIGFISFVLFCVLWMRQLRPKYFKKDDSLRLIRVGIFCSFIVWLIYSFLESFFLQFHIWAIFSLGSILVVLQRQTPESDAL